MSNAAIKVDVSSRYSDKIVEVQDLRSNGTLHVRLNGSPTEISVSLPENINKSLGFEAVLELSTRFEKEIAEVKQLHGADVAKALNSYVMRQHVKASHALLSTGALHKEIADFEADSSEMLEHFTSYIKARMVELCVVYARLGDELLETTSSHAEEVITKVKKDGVVPSLED